MRSSIAILAVIFFLSTPFILAEVNRSNRAAENREKAEAIKTSHLPIAVADRSVKGINLDFSRKFQDLGSVFQINQLRSRELGTRIIVSKNMPYKIECNVLSGIMVIIGTGENEEIIILNANTELPFHRESLAGRKLINIMCTQVFTNLHALMTKGEGNAVK